MKNYGACELQLTAPLLLCPVRLPGLEDALVQLDLCPIIPWVNPAIDCPLRAALEQAPEVVVLPETLVPCALKERLRVLAFT
jgi:hypothetical protein